MSPLGTQSRQQVKVTGFRVNKGVFTNRTHQNNRRHADGGGCFTIVVGTPLFCVSTAFQGSQGICTSMPSAGHGGS
jgi:hypothetical protein